MRNDIKRILHIVSAMDRGGAETLIMNVYRNLDRSKFQFDFITHGDKEGAYEKEIQRLGGRIIKIPSLGQIGPVKYVRCLIKIMKSNTYIAIHSHTDYQSGFPTLAAKCAGIPHRICHSHSTNWLRGANLKDKLLFKMLRVIMQISATGYCSCSKEAADFMFGSRNVQINKVKILKNGINLIDFVNVDKNYQKKLQDQLNLTGKEIIIGHVGTFSESKNHIFILKILRKLLETDERFVLFLVGAGPLKANIESQAKKMGIIGNIKFLGVRDDIPKLMRVFDVFLFPSVFEGFGIVTIEAQSAGTPCILSDAIPKSTDMGLGLVTYINLKEDIEVWCNSIKQSLLKKQPNNKTIIQKVSQNGYDIKQNISDWLELYGMKVMGD